jgi:hypothetical protein
MDDLFGGLKTRPVVAPAAPPIKVVAPPTSIDLGNMSDDNNSVISITSIKSTAPQQKTTRKKKPRSEKNIVSLDI